VKIFNATSPGRRNIKATLIFLFIDNSTLKPHFVERFYVINGAKRLTHKIRSKMGRRGISC
jgi:hypothetical protein